MAMASPPRARFIAGTLFAIQVFLLAGCGSGSSGSGPGGVPAEEPPPAEPAVVFPRWSVLEIDLDAAGKYRNPYTEVTITAVLHGPNSIEKRVSGFWAGGNAFKVRFTPTVEGRWRYEVTSTPADAGLTAEGEFTVTAPEAGAHGFLRRDPAYPRSFVHDDGTRAFIWGQTYYEILRNARQGGDWKRAIDGTRAHGMNKVRLLVNPSWDTSTEHYPRSSPFTLGSRDGIAMEHWQALDDVVEYLAQRDLIADLILFLDHHEGFGKKSQDLRYVRYVLARYAAYPNVIWCLTNEWNYTGKDEAFWNEIGILIRREDPWLREGDSLRPLSIHHQTGYTFDFAGTGWPVHAVIQVGVRNDKFEDGDRWGNHGIQVNSAHGIPVVNDEYGYLGEKDVSVGQGLFGGDKHRHTIWGIAAAGGYGSAGDIRKFDDGTPVFSANWQDAPEYGDIARLVGFWTERGIEYWSMSSRNDLVAAGDRVYVLAREGKEYVIYSAAGGTFALRLATGRYQATRFDPRTGATARFPDVSGDPSRSFPLPEGDDWVVHLRKTGN
jgi:hypothetical protein